MKTIYKKLWLKINLWAFKYGPPGYRADTEMSIVLINLVVALIYSIITYCYGLINDCIRILKWKDYLKNDVPRYLGMRTEEFRGYGRYLLEQSKIEMVMTPFCDFATKIILWFILSGVLVMMMLIVAHYMHYRFETKSIYVMKRLKGNKLTESYFKVPVWCFVIHMASCMVLLVVLGLINQLASTILL